MQIVLGNRSHPEYVVATIPFPILRGEYDQCIKQLAALEIGDAVQRDCQVLEVSGPWPALKRLEDSEVNLDELDYLAKRLDSFDTMEVAQYQAMTEKLNLRGMTDLINLTFCCQQATVITDFSNLEAIGRTHYMNLHGGCASMGELENLDGYKTALLLIDSGAGTVTRYGVVYDNGMRLEQLYDGKHLPEYHYEPDLLTISLTSMQEPKNTEHVTWLYLPAARGQIERAMLRSGIPDPEDMRFRFENSSFPAEINAALDFRQESIYELNDLAAAVETLSPAEYQKLGAAVQLAQPECASQIRHVAENLDQFTFAPGVHTPAEYGRYMIQESGHFDYDENLEGFYDYEKYGLQRMEQETGMLTVKGYISYHGALSLEELKSAQDSIPFQRMFPDGICRVTDNYYSKTVQFQDINYQLNQNEDKTVIFDSWCNFLNYFDSSIHFQLSFVNLAANKDSYAQTIAIPPRADAFNQLRTEYTKMLQTQLARGNNGLVKTKFITFGVEAENLKTAKPRLERIEIDILNNFKRLGVQAEPLNGHDRLKLMHDVLHMDEQEPFRFSWDWLAPSGLSVKDFIAPSSFEFRTGSSFAVGKKYGRASFLQILAPELNDRMLADFLDMESSVIVSMHIQSVDQVKAIKTIKRKITDLDKMKIEEQNSRSSETVPFGAVSLLALSLLQQTRRKI